MTPSPSRDQGEAGGGRGRRISLFGKSRSDCVMVAVGLSPRNYGGERVRVAERRLNRRANQALQASLRSEEHTSELQSLAYLVCRLLLEKKKKIKKYRSHKN